MGYHPGANLVFLVLKWLLRYGCHYHFCFSPPSNAIFKFCSGYHNLWTLATPLMRALNSNYFYLGYSNFANSFVPSLFLHFVSKDTNICIQIFEYWYSNFAIDKISVVTLKIVVTFLQCLHILYTPNMFRHLQKKKRKRKKRKMWWADTNFCFISSPFLHVVSSDPNIVSWQNTSNMAVLRWIWALSHAFFMTLMQILQNI